MAYPLTGSALSATGGVVIAPLVTDYSQRTTDNREWGVGTLATFSRTAGVTIAPLTVVGVDAMQKVPGTRVWAPVGISQTVQQIIQQYSPPTVGQLWPRGDRTVTG